MSNRWKGANAAAAPWIAIGVGAVLVLGCGSVKGGNAAGASTSNSSVSGTSTIAAGTSSGASSAVNGPSHSSTTTSSGSSAATMANACDASVCVFGAIGTAGLYAQDASAGTQPSAAQVSLIDEGFEFGELLCTDGGSVCVTGAITP